MLNTSLSEIGKLMETAREPLCKGADSAGDPTVALLPSCVIVQSKSESILDKYTNPTRNRDS